MESYFYFYIHRLYFLGVLYHRWKKKESAAHMYEKALSVNPNMKSAQDNLRKLMNQ